MDKPTITKELEIKDNKIFTSCKEEIEYCLNSYEDRIINNSLFKEIEYNISNILSKWAVEKPFKIIDRGNGNYFIKIGNNENDIN